MIKRGIRQRNESSPCANRDPPQHLDNPRNLVVFRAAGEKRETKEKFGSDATERPHINRTRVSERKIC